MPVLYHTEYSELKLTLKKLSKKDSVTKVKALQDLLDIFQNRSVDVLQDALQHWSYIYVKLIQDNDRKVRCLAHTVNGILIPRVKKLILPFLEVMMGPWYLSMNEQIKEVKDSAVTAFASSFPPTKQDAIISSSGAFILQYLTRTLSSTVDTLSDMKVTSEEEAQERYERMISTALHALGELISLKTSVLDPHEALGIAWKLMKSKFPKGEYACRD